MAYTSVDCPRCGVQKTSADVIRFSPSDLELNHPYREMVSVCRSCDGILLHNVYVPRAYDMISWFGQNVSIERFINIRKPIIPVNAVGEVTLEYLPKDIRSSFEEATTCRVIGLPNAAGAMYRLTLDLATRHMLPTDPNDTSLPRDPLPNYKGGRPPSAGPV